MAREYVSGAYSNGSTFNGYFDLDFGNLTAGGRINAAGRDFEPGRKLNSNIYFDDTNLSLQSTDENKYQLAISVTNNASGGSRTFYNLTFNFTGTNPNIIDSGTYQSVTVIQFSTRENITRSDVTTSTVSTTPFPVCFTTSTRLRTTRGDIAVEDLRVGDRAVTASGALRPVVWIGHRALESAGPALPHDQQPVRIRADAFGPGLPARDLRLSPGHPVLVAAGADGEGGHLVPVMCLINGTSISREPVSAVTYRHVELDAHDILLAEGLPAESYLDWGDRPFFDEASDHALHNPDVVVPGLAARCRPVSVDGPVVEAERARLSGVFATTLGEACAWDEAERFTWIAA